jgi:hypothetical protein
VSKDEIDFVIGAQIGQPVPAEDTFDADNDIFDKGKHQFKVDDHFALTVQDADIHFPGMQIDTAVILVLPVVKFHGVPPFAWVSIC